jgi:hypothetical protein
VDLEKLRQLLDLLRAAGVTEFSDGTVTLRLAAARPVVQASRPAEERDPIAALERAALGALLPNYEAVR